MGGGPSQSTIFIIIKALRSIFLTDSFNTIIYFLLKQNDYYSVLGLFILLFPT